MTGCSANAPAIVLDAYSPGDGVGAELGEVAVRNLVVVSEGDGAPGVLIGALVNRADLDVNMLVQAEGGLEQLVLLEAGQVVELGTGGEAVVPQAAGTNPGAEAVATVFESVDPIAGDTVPVTVVSEVAGSVTLQVPITSPVREYATITPQADPDLVVVVPDVDGTDGTAAAEDD